MSVQDRAGRLANASPLIALAVEESAAEDAAVLAAVQEVLEQLGSAQLLRCFSVVLYDDPTSETFATARGKSDEGRRAWLLSWLGCGDFWPDEVLDAAYGC
jgi:hypothetical protein